MIRNKRKEKPRITRHKTKTRKREWSIEYCWMGQWAKLISPDWHTWKRYSSKKARDNAWKKLSREKKSYIHYRLPRET